MGQTSDDTNDTSLQQLTETKYPMAVVSTSPISTASSTELLNKSLLASNDDLTSQEEEETAELPPIELQRDEINRLFQEHNNNAKEGDKMFVIPKFWYDYFF